MPDGTWPGQARMRAILVPAWASTYLHGYHWEARVNPQIAMLPFRSAPARWPWGNSTPTTQLHQQALVGLPACVPHGGVALAAWRPHPALRLALSRACTACGRRCGRLLACGIRHRDWHARDGVGCEGRACRDVRSRCLCDCLACRYPHSRGLHLALPLRPQSLISPPGTASGRSTRPPRREQRARLIR